jgi:hypothetical protein
MIRLLRLLVVGFGLALGMAAIALPWLEAQGPLSPAPGDPPALLGGLGDKLKGAAETNRFNDLRYGKKSVKEEEKENRVILEKAARYYAYRLTNPMYEEAEKNPEKLTMNGLVQEALDKLLVQEIKKKTFKPDQQGGYVKAFSEEMHKCLRDVLSKNSKPVVRINATRILVGIAETCQGLEAKDRPEEVADTFVILLKNPNEIEAVKLWACRGLKELLEQGTPTKSILDPKRERECITALVEFIARPRPASLPADAPADEVGGYQYVRREAYRALGNTRYPVVSSVKGPEGQTAQWLLRTVRKKHIDPEPSLAEQAEAAIGLCLLQVSLDTNYNVDFAASQVGTFLLDYIKNYNDQRASKVTTLPWKLYTARITLALDSLNAQAKIAPKRDAVAPYVDKLVSEAKKPLREIELDKDASPNALDDFLRNIQPPNSDLVKGSSEAILKPKE